MAQTPTGRVNTKFLDGYSWAHFGIAILGGLVGIRYPVYMAIHVAYDLGEQVFERTTVGQRLFRTSGPENLLNVCGDTLSASAGWVIGRWIRRL